MRWSLLLSLLYVHGVDAPRTGSCCWFSVESTRILLNSFLLHYINFQITSYGAKTKDPDYAARKADHISHFILRLSFCRTEELRRWFISRELDLFRLRWLNLSSDGKSDFIRLNNLNYEPVSLTFVHFSNINYVLI